MLRHKYSASLQHRGNWCQLPLRIARCPSRANGGAPVPVPMVALPFRRLIMFVRPTPVPLTPHQFHPFHLSLVCSNQPVHRDPSRVNVGAPVLALPFRWALTTVRTTPVPPMPHPVHPSHPLHPCSNQPMHKTMCPHPAIMIQSNTADTIQPIQPIQSRSSDTVPRIQSIQPIQYSPSFQQSNKANQYPSSVASLPRHLVIPHILLMPPHLNLHPPQQPLPPDICSLPLMLHLLLHSLLCI